MVQHPGVAPCIAGFNAHGAAQYQAERAHRFPRPEDLLSLAVRSLARPAFLQERQRLLLPNPAEQAGIFQKFEFHARIFLPFCCFNNRSSLGIVLYYSHPVNQPEKTEELQ